VAGLGIGAMVAAAAIVALRPRPEIAPTATTTVPIEPPAAPPPPSTIPPPSTTATSTIAPTPATARVPVERPMGTLSVNASPWATVHVNGKLAGTTPILRFPVRAGRASVTIENPKLGRKQVDVKIEPKKDTPLIVDLRGNQGDAPR
jgi:hypothetical protein